MVELTGLTRELTKGIIRVSSRPEIQGYGCEVRKVKYLYLIPYPCKSLIIWCELKMMTSKNILLFQFFSCLRSKPIAVFKLHLRVFLLLKVSKIFHYWPLWDFENI